MKKGVHPRYGPVAFRDTATGDLLLTSEGRVERRNGSPVGGGAR